MKNGCTAGGYIGIGWGATASYMRVEEVCRAGETKECKKIRVTEASGFAGALAGGIAGARIGIQAAKLCVVIGIPVGVAVCGVAVVGGSSLAGGLLVGPKLEAAAQLLYEPMP